MNGALHIGGIGLSTQQQALDVIAHNIANMNTNSFKRANVRFSELVASGVGHSAAPIQTQNKLNSAGVATDIQLMLNEQGDLQRTQNSLDIAIDGQGFIELLAPRGDLLLWRGGTLQVAEDGMLSTQGGLALKAMINIPTDATAIDIQNDGRVFAFTTDDEPAIELGQIELVQVEGAEALERLDGGLYRVTEQARVIDAMPGEDGMGRIVQGAVERSNVDLNTEMVQMMIVQRAYAANAQLVQAADQMLSIANNLRRS